MSTAFMFGNNISGDIIETKQKLARHLARLEELKQLVLATEQEVKRLKDKLIQYESVKPLSAERLYQGFWKASEDAGPESTDLLFDWLDDLDYEDLLNNDNFIAECIPDHVFDLIDLISETVYIPSLRPGEDAGDCAIFLPVLQEFQLIGEFSSVIERVGFHFPILKDLILEWGAHVQAKPWLPAVQPKRLRWDVNPIRFEVIKKVTEGVLRDLLLRYTTTKELRVPAFMRAVLLGLLVELSSDDTLPGIWEVVSFHSASGILEVLQVKDIIGSRK
ncbi:hypothetical protein M408DRAFT_7511 [Serendipita vermifera MAFF 305830]|uniref:Uncharacterized protein n=1 Tax=Serendipita vermifera MAFF 305830 TaxID=933852 RepID=A0A0C2WW57_SERVB|nr:hypothetical protein M408DRAFT_7511 [Serendipita vermifera MAFF 305830]